MNVLVGFDDAIDVDLDSFVSRWNADPKALDLGVAETLPSAVTLDVTLLEAAIVMLHGVAVGVAGNAIYDLVMGHIRGGTGRTTTTYEERNLPDGTRYVRIVRTDEEQ